MILLPEGKPKAGANFAVRINQLPPKATKPDEIGAGHRLTGERVFKGFSRQLFREPSSRIKPVEFQFSGSRITNVAGNLEQRSNQPQLVLWLGDERRGARKHMPRVAVAGFHRIRTGRDFRPFALLIPKHDFPTTGDLLGGHE